MVCCYCNQIQKPFLNFFLFLVHAAEMITIPIYTHAGDLYFRCRKQTPNNSLATINPPFPVMCRTSALSPSMAQKKKQKKSAWRSFMVAPFQSSSIHLYHKLHTTFTTNIATQLYLLHPIPNLDTNPTSHYYQLHCHLTLHSNRLHHCQSHCHKTSKMNGQMHLPRDIQYNNAL